MLYDHLRATCAQKAAGPRRVCDVTATVLYGCVRVFGGLYFGGG